MQHVMKLPYLFLVGVAIYWVPSRILLKITN